MRGFGLWHWTIVVSVVVLLVALLLATGPIDNLALWLHGAAAHQ